MLSSLSFALSLRSAEEKWWQVNYVLSIKGTIAGEKQVTHHLIKQKEAVTKNYTTSSRRRYQRKNYTIDY